MSGFERLTRRAFVRDLGRTSFGALVLGSILGACSPSGGAPEGSPTPGGPDGPSPSGDPSVAGTDWHRVDLGFVSAYLLARDGEVAVVDTGVAGSGAAIGETLAAVGLGWDAVAHLVLTHRHPDHVGSLGEVLAEAGSAAAYAGEADVAAIASPTTLTALRDGDEVFGLRIVATPGHTVGHISVLDEAAGVLVAGDALNGAAGGVVGPAPEFTDDMDAAMASVARLAELRFETVLFGHGEPVVGGADAAVRALRAG